MHMAGLRKVQAEILDLGIGCDQLQYKRQEMR